MIPDMQVVKKRFQLPFQKVAYIDMNPHSYRFDLHNMSKEKVPFNLPVVVTYSPYNPDTNLEYFKKYATQMTNVSELEKERTIKSVIHAEIRILSAGMTIEEMFSDKDKFKKMVSDRIKTDLNRFGVEISNSNIEEMSDLDDNKYFTFRKQKAIEGANNEARVEVAEVRKIGDIGEQERKTEVRQRTAEIEANTIKVENTRDEDIAESNKNLEVAKAEYDRQKQIAVIESTMDSKMKQIELQQVTEAKRVQQEIETKRAVCFVEAKVNSEAIIQRAEGEAEYKKKIADADYYIEAKHAEGLKSIYDAQSEGIKKNA
jgi:flotillin